MFADNTKFNHPITSHDDTTNLQNDLDCLQSWSAKWLLNFILHKCKVMSIAKSTACNHDIAYYLKNLSSNTSSTPIPCCTEEIDQGDVFDRNLSFMNHISMSIYKANKLLRIMRLFCDLNNTSLTHIYKAIVQPHIEYAATIWNSYKKKLHLHLEKVKTQGYKTSK